MPPFASTTYVGLIQVLDLMSYNLSYSSSRAEVWRWYWCSWRKRLWLLHMLYSAVLAVAIIQLQHLPLSALNFLRSFAIALPVTILGFAIAPQILFKSQERSLVVGPDGWSTTIGKRSGGKRWKDIASVDAAPDSVVITSSSGNALIVPARAFASRGAMQTFLKDTQAWLQGHAV